MAAEEKRGLRSKTSNSDELDKNLGFQLVNKFPSEKLPTKAQVIGHVTHLLGTGWNTSYERAIHMCGESLREHWIRRNI